MLLGMELCVNNSWSGSTVFQPRKGASSVGYSDRCVNLHNDITGEAPDIIAVFLGTNDFSYYQSTLGTADIDYGKLITQSGDGTWTYAAPTSTCEAYAIMLHRMLNRYPDAETYCMGLLARRSPDYPDNYADVGQPTAYNAQMKQIVEHFGATYVDLENCGIDADSAVFDLYIGDKRVHPNAAGMDRMTEAVLSAMLGEKTTICAISNNLSGVTTDNDTQVLLYGDTNGDGSVNTLDLIILRQYLAGWDVELDAAAADTNGNGTVNTLDLIMLRQYLAGWNVTPEPRQA